MIEKKAKLEDNNVFVEDNHSDVVRMQREEDNTVQKTVMKTTIAKDRKNIEDKNFDVKKTFGTTLDSKMKRSNVSDKILKLQDLVNGDECLKLSEKLRVRELAV